MVSAPKTPDPFQTAQAQSQWNNTTAQTQQALNMVNQNTPWGSLNYNQTGTQTIIGADGKPISVPQYTATTTLTPEQQAIFQQSQTAQGNLAGLAADQSAAMREYLSGGLDLSGLPDLATSAGQSSTIGGSFNPNFSGELGDSFTTSYAGADDFAANRDEVEAALWQRGAADRASADEALRTRLLNSGVREGSAAWNAEMERMGRQNTDARLATMLAGGQEQSRLVDMARNAAIFGNDAALAQGQFGQQAQQAGNAASLAQAQFGNQANLTNAQFQNAARGQGFQEAITQRNQPINELSALLSGSQVSMPQFQNTPQTGVAGVDYTGLVNNQYNAQMANHQNMMGGLFGLGAAGIGLFSDARLKEDLRRVGETVGGTPIYTYRYRGDPSGTTHMGVLAQDVPEARYMDPSGFYRVNYAEVR